MALATARRRRFATRARRLARDERMARLLEQGWMLADLAVLTGLTREQVIRRLEARGVGPEAIDLAR